MKRQAKQIPGKIFLTPKGLKFREYVQSIKDQEEQQQTTQIENISELSQEDSEKHSRYIIGNNKRPSTILERIELSSDSKRPSRSNSLNNHSSSNNNQQNNVIPSKSRFILQMQTQNQQAPADTSLNLESLMLQSSFLTQSRHHLNNQAYTLDQICSDYDRVKSFITPTAVSNSEFIQQKVRKLATQFSCQSLEQNQVQPRIDSTNNQIILRKTNIQHSNDHLAQSNLKIYQSLIDSNFNSKIAITQAQTAKNQSSQSIYSSNDKVQDILEQQWNHGLFVRNQNAKKNIKKQLIGPLIIFNKQRLENLAIIHQKKNQDMQRVNESIKKRLASDLNSNWQETYQEQNKINQSIKEMNLSQSLMQYKNRNMNKFTRISRKNRYKWNQIMESQKKNIKQNSLAIKNANSSKRATAKLLSELKPIRKNIGELPKLANSNIDQIKNVKFQ